MRYPKWLLITVIALLAINLLFYALWYALDIRDTLETKLEAILSKALNGTLVIGKLSFNERLITANNITFNDLKADIRINIKQVQVRYNLLRVFSSGFKFRKVIKDVVVYEPDIYFRYQIKSPSHKKRKAIPDITPYFDGASIKQGKLHIVFQAVVNDTLQILAEEKLSHVDAVATNRKKTSISASALTNNNGSVKATASLENGVVSFVAVEVEKYKPYNIRISGFKDLSTELSIIGTFRQKDITTEPEVDINSILWNTTAGYDKFSLVAPYIHINGNQNTLNFAIRESKVNTNRFSASGKIRNVLRQPYISCLLDVPAIDLGDFSPLLDGYGKGNLQIEGKFPTLTASGDIEIPEFEIGKEKMSALEIKATYNDKIITASTNVFRWRNQSSELTGSFDFSRMRATTHFATEPTQANSDLNITADVSVNLDLSDKQAKAVFDIENLSLINSYFALKDFSGVINLKNPKGLNKNFQYDTILENTHGIKLYSSGNLSDSNITATINMNKVQIDEYLTYFNKHDFPMGLSGIINASLNKSMVRGNLDLSAEAMPPYFINCDINSEFAFDIETSSGSASLNTANASAKGIPFALSLNTMIERNILKLSNLSLDEAIYASGAINLKNLYETELWIKADSVNIEKYWNILSPNKPSPIEANFSMELNYNSGLNNQVSGFINCDSLLIENVKPVHAILSISCSADKLILNGYGRTGDKNLVMLDGYIAVKPEMVLYARGTSNNLDLKQVIIGSPLSGLINGFIDWKLSLPSNKALQAFSCNLSGYKIVIDEIPIDSLNVVAAQTDEMFKISRLYLHTKDFVSISGKGALDYNILTNTYTGGNQQLGFEIEGDALRFLKTYVPYFETARGNISSHLTIGADENGINIRNGYILMANGVIKMRDQVNPFDNIALKASITDNVLIIDTLTCRIGNGKLYVRNEIASADDNFYIGPLNLGYFQFNTNNQDIQASIPGYLPPDTYISAIIRGQNTKYATVKGPFDDMEISGEVIATNGSAVYPANTKNILQLVNVFQRKLPSEALPLTFTLDLLVKVDNNVHYVTYPADLTIEPGSFLRLIYDGSMWSAQEADFSSEEGTLDFYGTIFDVDFVKIEINSKRSVLSVNGRFTKKADDGTLIILTVTTNPQKGDDFFNQLEFKLSSDNPQDVSQTQILSRLRYNKRMDDLTPFQRQTILQDEAMQLVSTSVNTTYVSQFLNPIENKIRTLLKLDSFSITTGFVQNLFVEFASQKEPGTSNTQQNNLNADILQFSSSVFLNNLSISLGKYLGNDVLLDYEIRLQETTDLAKKTKLDLYQNASLRLNLPWELRLSYTFGIRPARESNSHELMLQRSFRF
jgi:hypothetical protein